MLLLAVPLLLAAGCQCAAAPPSASTSALRPYVGGWSSHASYLTIRGDGTMSAEVQHFATSGTVFPDWDMVATGGTKDRLVARVTASNSKLVKVGWTYSFVRHRYGVKMSGPLGGRVFCNEYHRTEGRCGA